jgi:hypothetical protein
MSLAIELIDMHSSASLDPGRSLCDETSATAALRSAAVGRAALVARVEAASRHQLAGEPRSLNRFGTCQERLELHNASRPEDPNLVT